MSLWGDRIRELRSERGLRQSDLAEMCELSPSAIGMFERGARTPDISLIIKLADIFGVSADYLFGRSSERYFTADSAVLLPSNEEEYVFEKVLERDMDFLIMEEFVASSEFANLFLSKTKIEGDFSIISATHSLTDPKLGESDIEIIISCGGIKHAVLIENKINAVAAPEQYLRYNKRAIKGIDEGRYNAYSIFITAPQKYLEENAEAGKYDYSLCYEDMLSYFERGSSPRNAVKAAIVRKALFESKNAYNLVVDAAVSCFWSNLSDFAELNYPSLGVKSEKSKKGFWSRWVYFKTPFKRMNIVWKSDKGLAEIEVMDAADRVGDIERKISALSVERTYVRKAGKSAAIGVVVPEVDFAKPFSECIPEVTAAFDAVTMLKELVAKIGKI